jgi:hypothetical protein
MRVDRHMKEPKPTLVNVLIRDCRSITIGMLITIRRDSSVPNNGVSSDINGYLLNMSVRASKIGKAQNVRSHAALETGNFGKHFTIGCH